MIGFGRTRPRMNVGVTYLQMMTPPPPLAAPPADASVVRAVQPTASFYRYLYAAVGAEWLWFERRKLNDRELLGIVGDDKVEIQVLWVDGVPAGYAELDRRESGETEIAYFGLIGDFIGRGFGRWFIRWTVHHAWHGHPDCRRVWLHTCTLDHPRAVGVYQSAGLEPYRNETVAIADPREQFPDLGQMHGGQVGHGKAGAGKAGKGHG